MLSLSISYADFTLNPLSFLCFLKRQGKPPKEQGCVIPAEPQKSLKKKGKNAQKKKRKSSQGKKQQGIPKKKQGKEGQGRANFYAKSHATLEPKQLKQATPHLGAHNGGDRHVNSGCARQADARRRGAVSSAPRSRLALRTLRFIKRWRLQFLCAFA